MKPSTTNKTAAEVANGLKNNEFTSEELVIEALENIYNCSDQSIFINVTAQRALAEAVASDQRRKNNQLLSELDGVLIVWKDLFDLEGVATTAGSKIYENAVPAEKDAEVVSNCKALGLVCLGKTNLAEFAYSGLGLNPHYGTPINPNSSDSPKAPGGSSAGSAVAVALGLTPLAIGTDTAGSVRVPASFCGITGFKSSQNRYSKKGVFPLSSSLDSLGAFANNVDDLIQVDALMRGKASVSLPMSDIKNSTFLIPESIVFDGISSDIHNTFDMFVEKLKLAGATIKFQAFPLFDEVSELFKKHGTLTVAEAYTYHEDLLLSPQAEHMDQRVRNRMLTAKQVSTTDYIKLQWARMRLQQEVTDMLGDEFLLFPTTPITAPDIAELEASDELFNTTNLTALRNTMLGNYLGTPGVSFSIGNDAEGLPIGALISAPVDQDDRVLAVCRAVEDLL
ncbi:hypothetical protein EOL70_03075 [Leucothrix sargassi]|nr:hypothetical protein EOL70_03075 [Leucothrix sargassi]